ncbi:hypothetical protein JCM8202v2_002009 [Rhodotorula sphaerocarpa]
MLSQSRTATRNLSHLVLAGWNPLAPPGRSSAYQSGSDRQAVSNPSPAPVPLATWLASVGRELDVEGGYRINHVAGGAGHQLVTYRNYEGVDRILAIGRNEAGQLGVGFASQEGTRSLVEGFEGEEILAVRAGFQSSYLLLRDGDSTVLYSCGNLARGRLGHPDRTSSFNEAESAAGQEPRRHLLPQATTVPLPPELGRIKQVEAGFEHVLLLTESGEVYGTGCNTDGQIGLGDAATDVMGFTRIGLPPEIAKEGGVEYAQAMHARKIDQILRPTEMDHSFLPSNRRIVDYRCGGSFALALDDRGSVYSAGFGALGLGASLLRSERPRRIDALEGQDIARIRAGWGYAAAVRDAGPDSALLTWGLNSVHGRLGLGTLADVRSFDAAKPPAVPMHVHVPREVKLPLRELGLDGSVAGREDARWRIGEVELAMEGMWIALEAEQDVD